MVSMDILTMTKIKILPILSGQCLDMAEQPTTRLGPPCLYHNFLASKMGVWSKNFWYQYWAQMLAPLPFEEDKRKLYYVKVARCEYKWPASFPFHRWYILTIKCILTYHTNCEMYIVYTNYEMYKIHIIPNMKCTLMKMVGYIPMHTNYELGECPSNWKPFGPKAKKG